MKLKIADIVFLLTGERGICTLKDNTPYRLADKIALLLSKLGSDTESAFSIRESVTGFSWSNIAQRAIKEFREVLANYSALVH